MEFERVSYGIGNSWDAGVEFREGFLAPGMFFPMFFPLSTPSPFFPRAAVGVGGHQILGIRFFSPKFLACDLQGKNNSWEGGGGCGVTPGAGIASLDHSRSLGAPGSPEPIPSHTEFLREVPGEADWSFFGNLGSSGLSRAALSSSMDLGNREELLPSRENPGKILDPAGALSSGGVQECWERLELEEFRPRELSRILE